MLSIRKRQPHLHNTKTLTSKPRCRRWQGIERDMRHETDFLNLGSPQNDHGNTRPGTTPVRIYKKVITNIFMFVLVALYILVYNYFF